MELVENLEVSLSAAKMRVVLKTIAEIHRPTDEEIEFWAEGGPDDGEEHDQRYLDCPGGDRCEGHTATIKVCRECGYEHDGESPTFRRWPCPTIRALQHVVNDGYAAAHSREAKS